MSLTPSFSPPATSFRYRASSSSAAALLSIAWCGKIGAQGCEVTVSGAGVRDTRVLVLLRVVDLLGILLPEHRPGTTVCRKEKM